jgi:tetratricopeptide (TPR) repeat protein
MLTVEAPRAPAPRHGRLRGALALTALLLLQGLARAEEGQAPAEVAKEVDTALHTVLLIGAVLVVLILLAVVFIVYRKVLGSARPALDAAPTPEADPLAEAEREERRGNLVAAATRYDAAGEKLKAGACWEQVKDLARAAECYEAGGDLEKAAALYVRSGGSLRAAGVYMQMKNYMEAAKIFRNKGDHLRAAQALELYGNKVAAAREFAAAGSHARAARLYEEERMYAEAAAAYEPLLGGAEVTPGNADRHGTFAALLALAGETERAVRTYRRVLAAVPGHLRAMSGLQKLLPRDAELAPAAAGTQAPAAPPAPGQGLAYISPEDGKDYYEAAPPAPAAAEPPAPAARAPAPPPAPPAPAPVSQPDLIALAQEIEADPRSRENPLHRVFTLRSMIQAGRMEPRYSMRMWVQVMRALDERHRAGQILGCVTPDAITIDMENNIRIDPPKERPAEYLAPEVQAGIPPDRQADIYSMGVILFELLTGSLEHLGRRLPGELFADIPSWLDELIQRSTEKNLTRRYRTTEEVSQALVRLKNSAPE